MGGEEQSAAAFENLAFTKIFQTFRMAIQPTKLIIAFLALALVCFAGWIMDLSNPVVARANGDTELNIYMVNPERVQTFVENYKETGQATGLFSTLWHFAAGKFQDTLDSLFALNLTAVAANIGEYFSAVRWAVVYHPVYCVIFFVIKLSVISIAGGSICRISALQFARGEKPGLTEALRFGTKRFGKFFLAPLVPVGITIVLGLLVFILGLVANIPRAGELIMGVFVPLALLVGALIAIVSIGTAAGFNLMFPALAFEDSDCFDAISRSFSYVYARPWRMGFYTAVAAVYGAICYTFVRFFAFLLLLAAYLCSRLGIWVHNSTDEVNKLAAIWAEPTFRNLLGPAGIAQGNWSETCAAFLVRLSLWVVVGLVVSFIISFYFSANTIIYALLRNKVDDAAFDEIYTPLDAVGAEPGGAEPEPEQSQPQSDSETEGQ